jgi:hypothetical protein
LEKIENILTPRMRKKICFFKNGCKRATCQKKEKECEKEKPVKTELLRGKMMPPTF